MSPATSEMQDAIQQTIEGLTDDEKTGQSKDGIPDAVQKAMDGLAGIGFTNITFDEKSGIFFHGRNGWKHHLQPQSITPSIPDAVQKAMDGLAGIGFTNIIFDETSGSITFQSRNEGWKHKLKLQIELVPDNVQKAMDALAGIGFTDITFDETTGISFKTGNGLWKHVLKPDLVNGVRLMDGVSGGLFYSN